MRRLLPPTRLRALVTLAGLMAACTPSSPRPPGPGQGPAGFPKPVPTGRAVGAAPEPGPWRPPAVRPRPVEVIFYGPKRRAAGRATIQVVFNQPMVRLGRVRSRAEAPGRYPIEITPPVRAVYRWVTGDTLKVALTEPLRLATRYRVRLLPTLRSLAGTRLPRPLTWHFETPRPRVRGIAAQTRQPVLAPHLHPRDFFSISFNMPVSPAQLRAALQVVALRVPQGPRKAQPDPRPVPVRIARHKKEPRTLLVVPKRPLPEGTQVVVAVREGLRALPGPLPGVLAFQETFRVRGPLSASVSCNGRAVLPDAAQRGGPCWPMRHAGGYRGLELHFSEPVTRAALRAHLRITPPVANLAKRLVPTTVGCTLRGRDRPRCARGWAVAGDLRPRTAYRVRITAGLRDVWGQRLRTPHAVRFSTRDFPPGLHLPAGGEAFREAWHPWRYVAVNATRVRERVLSLRGGTLAAFLGCTRYDRRSAQQWPEACLAGHTLQTRWVRLPRRPNRLLERRPGLPLGAALLRLDSPQVVDHAGDRVSFDSLALRTGLGLHARLSAYGVTAWVTRLRTGRPVQGAAITVYEMTGPRAGRAVAQGTTDAAGFARLAAKALRHRLARAKGLRLLVAARKGDDESYVTPAAPDYSVYVTSEDGSREWTPAQGLGDRALLRGDRPWLVGHVSTERGIYRPGHRVYFHGAVRRFVTWRGAPAARLRLSVRIRGPRGTEVGRTEVETNDWGVFLGHLDLPASATLGYYVVAIRHARRRLASHWFRVAAYRPPRFVARVRPAARRIVGDGALSLTLAGRYLFGGPMGGAGFRLTVRQRPGHLYWDHLPGFSAGGDAWDLDLPRGVWHRSEGVLDKDGRSLRKLPLPAGPTGHNPWPTWHQVELTVSSAARRTAAARDGVQQVPGNRLVAVKTLDARKDTLRFHLRAVDPDGRATPAGQVRAALLPLGKPKPGLWVRPVLWSGTPLWTRTLALPAAGRRIAIRWPRGYAQRQAVLLLSVRDAQGREARTALRVDRPSRGSLEAEAAARRERARREALRISLDKDAYLPGETAVVTVQREPSLRSATLFVERERIFAVHPLRFDARGRAVLRIPVRRAYAGQVTLRAVGVRAGKALRGPLGPVATAEATLSVKSDPFLLSVGIRTDRSTYRPGDRVRVSVAVRDFQKRPRQAAVVIMAVDEAVLNLTGYRLPNPYRDLAYTPPDGVFSDDVRNHLARLGIRVVHVDHTRPETHSATGYGMGGFGSGGACGSGRASTRSRRRRPRRTFRTTAWHTALVTDSAGRATAQFTLPDNLTRYRLMAFAVDRDRSAGTGAAHIEVRLPVLSLTALPRFLREGDRAQAGVVIYNRALPPAPATVRLHVHGDAVALEGPSVRRTQLPKGAAREVRFALRARRKGTARLAFTVEAGGRTDRLEARLRVQRPVVPEAASVAGETRGAVRHGIEPLAGLRRDVGGLELALASTALSGVEDGMEQLLHYPYGCLEQTASRMLPSLAAAVLGNRFALALPSDPKPFIRAGLRKIFAMQQRDGGFSYWPGGRRSWVWATAWALVVLHRAQQAARATGVPVDRRAVRRAVDYLRAQVMHRSTFGAYWFTHEAFLLYALSLHGAPMRDRALALFRQRRDAPLFARALLLGALARAPRNAATQRAIAALVTELGDGLKIDGTTAHAEEGLPAAYGRFWHSDDRTTAMVLLTLLQARPDHPLATKLVRWFLVGRKQVRFRNTQEAAWALLAFWDFAAIRERTVPDFEAGVWLGGKRILGARFRGRSVRTVLRRIPMAALQQAVGRAARDLVVAKRGPGTLYYVARLRYARRALPTSPRDHGFGVSRSVVVLDRAGRPLAKRRPPRLGDTVLVTLRVRTTEARRYVAIEDPLPAGLEAIDTTLATASREGTEALDWRTQSAYDYRELRDDRVVYFRDYVPPGTLTYRYLARVTTPGRFRVPPTRAVEMYTPEVFGHAASRWVDLRPRPPR